MQYYCKPQKRLALFNMSFGEWIYWFLFAGTWQWSTGRIWHSLLIATKQTRTFLPADITNWSVRTPETCTDGWGSIYQIKKHHWILIVYSDIFDLNMTLICICFITCHIVLRWNIVSNLVSMRAEVLQKLTLILMLSELWTLAIELTNGHYTI